MFEVMLVKTYGYALQGITATKVTVEVNISVGVNFYLEASACAKPVVVGNSGGAADAVIDGVTGILVDSSKVNEISNAICKLLDDPIKGKEMGQAGRDWVIENWQMSNWSKKFNQLLLEN